MRILLTGKNGQVGWELQRALPPLGHVIALSRDELDLTSADAIRKTMRDVRPDVVINAAAYTAVDRAETEPDLATAVNGTAPGIIAEEARRLGAFLVHYSTDYVFDGTKNGPYQEDDAPNPLNVYGRSKLAGENAIRASGVSHYIFRTSWVYAARSHNFVLTILRLAREQKELAVVDDQIGSPTWARTLADSTVELLGKSKHLQKETGIYHLSAKGYTSRYGFARAIIDSAGKVFGESADWAVIKPTTTANYPLPAVRPLNAVMSKDKFKRVFGVEMPSWEMQLDACFRELLGSGKPE